MVEAAGVGKAYESAPPRQVSRQSLEVAVSGTRSTLPEQCEISGNQSFLLRACPSFQLSLAL